MRPHPVVPESERLHHHPSHSAVWQNGNPADPRREPPKIVGDSKGGAFMEGGPTNHRPRQADGGTFTWGRP